MTSSLLLLPFALVVWVLCYGPVGAEPRDGGEGARQGTPPCCAQEAAPGRLGTARREDAGQTGA